MSTATRDAVTARLAFNNASARDDLQEQWPDGRYKVHTNVVALLDHLTRNCPYKILITALCDDHGDSRPGDPWSHRGGGCVDLWNANYAEVGDSGIEVVLRNIAINPYVAKLGFGGYAQRYYGAPYIPARIVQFYDNASDHLHLECIRD